MSGDAAAGAAVRFAPFAPPDLRALGLEAGFEDLLAIPAALETLCGPWAETATAGGRVIGCAGLTPVWPGRAMAWAALDLGMGARAFAAIHRRARHGLAAARAAGFRRIEAAVDPDFPGDRALRWARALGFAEEGRLRHWTPDGRDMISVVLTGD